MKKIAIFCGGYSSEWEISLKSAQTIAENFPSEYTVLKVIVQKESVAGRSRWTTIPVLS